MSEQAKVLLIGDSGVGKTALLQRYIEGNFIHTLASTIGIDFRTKLVTVGDRAIKLQIWDTAGQERFRAITAAYFRAAVAVLFVYDITSRSSFENLNIWHELYAKNGEAPVKFLVGTKSDRGREVSEREAEQWAAEHSCTPVECSSLRASDAELIDQIFFEVAFRAAKHCPPIENAPLLLDSTPASSCRC